MKDTACGETGDTKDALGKQVPRKWNAIVGNGEDESEAPLPSACPVPQPNRRERSESLPCIPNMQSLNNGNGNYLSTLSEADEFRPKAKTTDDDFSNTLYRAIWKTLDGTMATSPVRSPVVADWKVVGSPSGSIQKINDPSDQLLEDEARLRDGSGSISGFSSVDRSRRMRSASVIGELLHSGSTDIFHSAAGSPVNFEASGGEKRNGGIDGQVAQLPIMLHEDLGLENEAEATEIFKRSSMESILDELGDGPERADTGHHTTDFFKNMTFGPLGNSVFPASAGPVNPTSPPSGMDRRRPSYLGLTDWPLSAGAIGTGRPDYYIDETSVDDYFSSPSIGPWNIPSAPRLSRRHSLIAPDGGAGLEDHFSQLGFGSVPKGDSPPKHQHQQQQQQGYNNYAGHGSMSNVGYFGDSGEFEGAFSAAHAAGTHPSSYHSNDPPFQLSSYVGPLWAVEFKSGRTEIFYVLEVEGEPQSRCSVGDLVIVEADRGEDLGRVTAEISVAKMRLCISGSDEDVGSDKNEISTELAALLRSKEIVPKRIHRLAQNNDLKLLQAKAQEEALAMVRCQSRIRQKKLPMDVVDAEYQWDRNKLTFYFIADRRIDFRELVRDLFRIYKTRIWMCAVDKTSPRMINYLGGLVPVHSNPLEEEEVVVAGATLAQPALVSEPIAVPQAEPVTKASTISYKAVASHENL